MHNIGIGDTVTRTTILLIISLFSVQAQARECTLPSKWHSLCGILEQRINQSAKKMKLRETTVTQLEDFLTTTSLNLINLTELQAVLPKTTIELLMAIKFRNVSSDNAESVAKYLQLLTTSCNFANIQAFDNNTSHIIGRDWHEIDYAGEGMTWQKQQKKYAPYGITNFKTIDNIQKFFPVEAKLPYFIRIYKPANAGLCNTQLKQL